MINTQLKNYRLCRSMATIIELPKHKFEYSMSNIYQLVANFSANMSSESKSASLDSSQHDGVDLVEKPAISSRVNMSEMKDTKIMSPEPTRVIIADDHPLFRDAIAQILPGIIGDCEIDSVDNFEKLYASLSDGSNVDLVLMDLHMPGNKGFTGLATIRAEFPAVAVVMVSASESTDIVSRALNLGVSGYIPKSAGFEQIKTAINSVFTGEIWLPEQMRSDIQHHQQQSPQNDDAVKIASLTPQQLKVLSMISVGMLNKQIAYELNIQETTIKHHVSAILKKLEVNNRTLAGIMYKELQIDDESQELKKA